MTRILVISPSEVSVDPRVLRHLAVGKEFGSVYTCGYGPKPDLSDGHFPIPSNKRYLPRSLRNLAAIQLHAHESAARNTQFYRACLEMLKHETFDLVIANDVHSLQISCDLFPSHQIWADMHEYAPLEAEHDWRWRLAFQAHIRHLCNVHLSNVAVVSSVSKAICNRFSDELKRPVHLIRNSSVYKQTVPNQSSATDGLVRCVHAGAAIRARRLEDLIMAVADLPSTVTLDLLLIPTDSKYFVEIQALTEKVSNVRLVPAVPQADLINVLATYDVGCVAIPPTSFNYANCLPNKFFQYVQARIPILTGPTPEIAQTVREYEIGWVTDGFSAGSNRQALAAIDLGQVKKFRLNLELAAKKLSAEVDDDERRRIFRFLLGNQNG